MRTSLPALARFVDRVAIAVEGSTPLDGVLPAHAADVPEAGRRACSSQTGARRIAMTVPIDIPAGCI